MMFIPTKHVAHLGTMVIEKTHSGLLIFVNPLQLDHSND